MSTILSRYAAVPAGRKVFLVSLERKVQIETKDKAEKLIDMIHLLRWCGVCQLYLESYISYNCYNNIMVMRNQKEIPELRSNK